MGNIFSQVDFRGSDAATFLQGYLTADLDGLRAGVAVPMACCNLRGRVIASGWAAGGAEHVRLLLPVPAVAGFMEHLRKYLLFSKSRFVAPEGGIALAPERSHGALALPPTRWFAGFDAPGDSGHAAFADICVEAGFVTIAPPVAERFLPQMVGLTDAGAVSFAKGCYLGQEVVARAEHRGAVKQRLRAWRVTGARPPIGAEVLATGRTIGVVVAASAAKVLAATREDAPTVTINGATLPRVGD